MCPTEMKMLVNKRVDLRASECQKQQVLLDFACNLNCA